MSKRAEPDAISVISEADYEEECAPDAAEEAQLEEAEHFDELGCIGFALARSVSLMGHIRSCFQDGEGSAECLDAAWMKPLIATCSEDERMELSRCMEMFFARRPLLQSTPQPKRGSNPSKDLEACSRNRSWVEDDLRKATHDRAR